MNLEIRPVTPAEYEAVGALTLTAYDAVGSVGEDYRRSMLDVAGRCDDETTVLVAVLDGEVVGSVTIPSAGSSHFEHAPHGDGGFRMLAVAPSAQGLGVGAALVAAVHEHARTAGWRRLVISSMEWMPTAHGMYERAGYTRRRDLDVRYLSGVGYAFQLDLVEDAGGAFPQPGPVPAEPRRFVGTEHGPMGC